MGLASDGSDNARALPSAIFVGVFSIILASAMVALLLVEWPRILAQNDDVFMRHMLRENTLTPYMAPLLSQALGFLYTSISAETPWYGLYLYAVSTLTLATIIAVPCYFGLARSRNPRSFLAIVVIALVAFLVPLLVGSSPWLIWAIAALASAGLVVLETRYRRERTSGLQHALDAAQALGYGFLTAAIAGTFAIVIVRLTFTQVAVTAATTGLALLLISILWTARESRAPSRAVCALAGILFLAGYTARMVAIPAAAFTTGPLLLWTCYRLIRARHTVPVRRLAWFAAPIVIAICTGTITPQTRDPAALEFIELNAARGALSGHAAFTSLDRRGSSLLKEAGWSRQDARRFGQWMYFDDSRFDVEKLERLRHTGGVPITDNLVIERALAKLPEPHHSGAAFFLALIVCIVGAAVSIALRGRRLEAVLYILYPACLFALFVYLAMYSRLPARASVPVLLGTAVVAYFGFLATWNEAQISARRAGAVIIVVGIVLVLALPNWASSISTALARPQRSTPARTACDAALAEMTRRAFVFAYPARITPPHDPLVESRKFWDAASGWTTFSPPFYRALERELGITRSADLLASMADNKDAYYLINTRYKGRVEAYIQQELGPSAHLEVAPSHPESCGKRVLYRIVATPSPATETE